MEVAQVVAVPLQPGVQGLAIPLAWTTLKSPVTETPMVSGALPPATCATSLLTYSPLVVVLHLHFQAGVLLGEQIALWRW